MNWFIYIVRCKDKSFYTGITNNLERRMNQHNTSKSLGSRYARTRRPVKLVFSELTTSRSKALKREAEIKKLSRKEKFDLISYAENIRN